ncbi:MULTISPECIES: hypothetical protein [unclassified Lysobacter]|uniref:hypothetical protein n=1 Tax=unclassified Lysobacter TaxID=2635362 RepID=UPI001BE6F9DA|nr:MULTISPECIES: hypothetical protein [unclassified Lysobacter]MBT2745599.1 hypothetical protein [Lysobacter sp. ISL-42]MBT2753538.1 hypothetical protein [Lysobacter sp. ISL-50]MBT2777078.1 hypothetical protein [Lysobacter sp. ISL-54]MBT2780296.1 hypothetical protein [Lysobacter sp. ISL-52]
MHFSALVLTVFACAFAAHAASTAPAGSSVQQWSPPRIASEIGALLSPDGHSMLFSRGPKDQQSGELFLWRDGRDDASWPPRCPRPR